MRLFVSKRMCFAFVCLLVLNTTVSQVKARTFRVTSQSDFNKVESTLKPGDEVIIADGSYRDNLQIRLRGNGTAEAPIIFRAETAGRVTLTGKPRVLIEGTHIVVRDLVFDQAWGPNIVAFKGAKHCRLSNCVFIECGDPDSPFSHIVTLKDKAAHNRIDHCYMVGNISMGMGVINSGATGSKNVHNRFDHNWYHNIVRRGSNGQEPVQLGQSARRDVPLHALVEHCLFEATNGDSEAISNKSAYNTYRYNTFRNCKAALVLRGSSHATVEGNFFIGGNGGVRVFGKHHRIINNYIIDTDYGFLFPAGSARDTTNTIYQSSALCLIAHNTIIRPKTTAIHLGGGKGKRVVNSHGEVGFCKFPPCSNRFVNNLIIDGTVRDQFSALIDWESNVFARSTTTKASKGGSSTVLQLTKSDGLERPAVDSKIVDAAVLLEPQILNDVEGQLRGKKPDIGADEHSDAAVTRRPLQPKDVGPTWMQGKPGTVRRIPNPRPIPPLPKQ